MVQMYSESSQLRLSDSTHLKSTSRFFVLHVFVFVWPSLNMYCTLGGVQCCVKKTTIFVFMSHTVVEEQEEAEAKRCGQR